MAGLHRQFDYLSAIARTNDGEVEVRIDGQVQGYINLKNSTTITRAVFWQSECRAARLASAAYRDTATVDAFITPGIAVLSAAGPIGHRPLQRR